MIVQLLARNAKNAQSLGKKIMNVAQLVCKLNLQSRVESALAANGKSGLPARAAALPVHRSHALKRLGSYVARGEEPVAIRLQFAVEEEVLIDTFLHELAHCLDHLLNQPGKRYRSSHGRGWKRWAESFGIDPVRCGESATLKRLHAERLKVVAVCKRCGFELKRLKRLPRNRRYLHPKCGGRLVPVREC